MEQGLLLRILTKQVAARNIRMFYFDSGKLTSNMYRDTRLGGSSPAHRTYKANDYGAGAITTDPNKGNSSGSSTLVVVYPAPDSTGKKFGKKIRLLQLHFKKFWPVFAGNI